MHCAPTSSTRQLATESTSWIRYPVALLHHRDTSTTPIPASSRALPANARPPDQLRSRGPVNGCRMGGPAGRQHPVGSPLAGTTRARHKLRATYIHIHRVGAVQRVSEGSARLARVADLARRVPRSCRPMCCPRPGRAVACRSRDGEFGQQTANKRSRPASR
jgi:hypothetical protein